jgi:hypothetical protein
LQQQLRISDGPWLRVFLQDEALLRGRSPSSSMLGEDLPANTMVKSLRLASTALCQGFFAVRQLFPLLNKIFITLHLKMNFELKFEFESN